MNCKAASKMAMRAMFAPAPTRTSTSFKKKRPAVDSNDRTRIAAAKDGTAVMRKAIRESIGEDKGAGT